MKHVFKHLCAYVEGKKNHFLNLSELTAHLIHHAQKAWPIILKEPSLWQKCGKMQIERIQLAEKMLKTTNEKSLATMNTTRPRGQRHGADIADRG